MLSSTSGPTRSRDSTGRHPHVARYARNPIPVADPNQMFDWYASGWAEDPLNTPPVVAYTNMTGLVLPGVAGNYASVPDAAALDITGDITLVARVALDDWTPAAITGVLAKWGTDGDRSFYLAVNAGGALRLVVSPTGFGAAAVSTNSTALPTVTDGATLWIAATLDVDDGAGNRVVKFWTSSDGTTWAQLGTTITTAGTTSIDSGASVVEFGSLVGGTANPLDGTLSVARVYSGSGFSAAGPSGSLVLDVDFRRPNTPTFTAATGQTVTVSTAGSISTWRDAGSLGTAFEQATSASQPTYDPFVSEFNNFAGQDYDGTDDKLTILTGVSLAQPFTATFIGVADSLSQQNLLGLNDGATGRGLRISVTGAILYVSAAGSVTSAAGVITAGVPFIAICYVTGTSVVISVNNVTVASGALVGDDVNQIVVGSGRNSGGSFANPFNGKVNFTSLIGGFPYIDQNSLAMLDLARARGCPVS